MFFFFDHFPPALIVIAIVMLMMIFKSASTSRRYTMSTGQRLCPGCGTSHPAFASFCKRCGRKL